MRHEAYSGTIWEKMVIKSECTTGVTCTSTESYFCRMWFDLFGCISYLLMHFASFLLSLFAKVFLFPYRSKFWWSLWSKRKYGSDPVFGRLRSSILYQPRHGSQREWTRSWSEATTLLHISAECWNVQTLIGAGRSDNYIVPPFLDASNDNYNTISSKQIFSYITRTNNS